MKKHFLQREQFCALLFCFVSFLTFYGRNCQAGEAAQPSTFCNPLNLPYRFSLESPSRREAAADPTIVRWNNEYWRFASKSGGYWHSSDFAHWTLVVPSGLPIENYAPDAEVINGRGPSSNGMQTGFTRLAARLGHSLTPHIALFRSRRPASSVAPALVRIGWLLRCIWETIRSICLGAAEIRCETNLPVGCFFLIRKRPRHLPRWMVIQWRMRLTKTSAPGGSLLQETPVSGLAWILGKGARFAPSKSTSPMKARPPWAFPTVLIAM